MAKTKLREEMIRVRFTTDELATARAGAKAEGLPVSTYLRHLAVTTHSVPIENAAKIKRTLAALDSMPAEETL